MLWRLIMLFFVIGQISWALCCAKEAKITHIRDVDSRNPGKGQYYSWGDKSGGQCGSISNR